jgi:hypothetical protein
MFQFVDKQWEVTAQHDRVRQDLTEPRILAVLLPSNEIWLEQLVVQVRKPNYYEIMVHWEWTAHAEENRLAMKWELVLLVYCPLQTQESS